MTSGQQATPLARGPQQRPTRRRHAARKSRVAALILSCATTGSLTALLGYVDHANASSVSAAASTTRAATVATLANTQVSAAGPTVAAASQTAGAVTPTTGTATAGASAATAGGTYAGAVVPNRYGDVQVQITVSGGKITAATALQAPGGARKSVSINNRAVPTLNSEASAAQSASIQAVSGATYTSNGYAQSLQSAIDQAKTAGALTA
jgi:uncharacterized protein with FMN-binding domain